ncbi:two-partner secretion domain-containing protein [Erwinia sp. SLM-02]|uniref:two-partner secretion domain-containing protein n=1 Tax=Erwinia sp. SLM-02 TaxID=3020057 RepID=UPI00307FFF0E
MNRRCYRIIFNRARRMLVVVSELARARGGDTARGPGISSSSCIVALRPLTAALWLAAGLIGTAQAGTIAPDRGAPGGQRPTVLQTGNGLPQVNIQSPNGQGLSHNRYGQFDVGDRGAILNNSQHSTQTQLAGQIAGNPWLAKGSAKVILNEVNSTRPSQLHGFIEVAGKKADVIIANPAGITCSGCGFINAGRSTLAAGRVQLKNGQVAGYDIDRGRIIVSGGGMDATGQDYTHLIARAVEVNARLQAGDLTVTTGRNLTDAGGRVTEVKADDPQGRPQFAVDTAALGGMYGRHITLVGTERGLGVRNAGEIGATQGGFTLNAQGKIANSGTLYAQQDLALKAAQLDNQGHISTGGSLRIASQGDVSNRGTLSADGDLQLDSRGRLHGQAGSALLAGGNATVTARTVEADSGSSMGAGIDSRGSATRQGSLSVTAEQRLTSHGTHLSHDGFSASGREVDLSGSQSRAATAAVTAREGNLNADDALIDARQTALSTAHILTTRGSAIAADRLTLRADEGLDNHGGTLISRDERGLTLQSQRIDNGDGTLVSAGNLTLTGHVLDNTGGELGSENGSVVIQGGDILGAEGKILAAGDLSLDGKQIRLDGALTQGQQVRVQGSTLSLQNGQLLQTGQGEMQITATGHLDSRGGDLESAGAIALRAGSLDNRQGRIAGNGTLRVETGDLDNTAGTLAGLHLEVRADALTNREGTIEALQSLNLTAGSLDSQRGFISADGGEANLSVAGDVDNRDGNLQSAKNLTLSAGRFANQDGRVLAAGGLLEGRFRGGADNHGGKFIAQQLMLQAADLNNRQGVVSALSGTGTLDLQGALDNRGGTLEGENGLTLNASSLDNTAGRIATPGALGLDLHGGELINAQTHADGLGILSGADLTLTTGLFSNQQGQLQARNLDLTATQVNNQAGSLMASEGLNLTGTSLDNAGGLVSADGGAASLALSGELANRQGTLQSQRALDLQAASLDNDGGRILSAMAQIAGQFSGAVSNLAGSVLAGTALDLQAGSVDNRQGAIAATHGDARLSTTGLLANQGGDIESSGQLRLKAANVDNSGGQLLAAEAMQISTHGLTTAAGLIQAGDALSIDTHGGALLNGDTLSDTAGIRAGGALTLTAGDVDNHNGLIRGDELHARGLTWNNLGGEIDSLHALTLSGTALGNQGGLISAGEGDLTASLTQGIDNQQGTLQSSRSLLVTAGALDNGSGALLAAGGNASVTVEGALNNQQGKVLARDDLQLTAARVDNQGGGIAALNGAALIHAMAAFLNQSGTVDSGGALQLSGESVDNHDGQLVAAGGALTVSAGTTDNQRGRLAARDDVRVVGQSLDNRDGTITSVGGELNARLDGAIDNQRGVLQSGQGVVLTSASLDNRSGSVLAVSGGNQIAVRGELRNAQGQIVSGGATGLQAASLDNQGGAVSSQNGTLGVTVTGAVNNQQGSLEADGTVDIASDSLDNRAASILSATGSLTVSTAQSLNNQQGRLAARQDVTLTADGLNNQQGTVTAVDKTLTVHGGQRLDNSDGTLQSRGGLAIDALNLTNLRGTIQSIAADGRLTIGGPLNNQSGSISAHGALTLDSGDTDNRQGLLLAALLDLTTRQLNNQAGLIQGSDGLRLDTRGQLLDNRDTDSATTGLRSGGELVLNAGDINNQGGLMAGDRLSLSGLAVSNQAGTIGSAGDSQIASGPLDNLNGTIRAGGDLRLDTRGADLQNQQGKLLADGALALSTGSLGNDRGLIQGGTGLTLKGGHFDNQHGQALSGADLTASVNSLNNSGGQLFAAGNAQVTAGQSVQNQQGLIKAGQTLVLTADQIDNQHTRGSGQGIEAQDLTLNATALSNQDGALRAGDALQANVGGLLSNQSGLISSQNSLRIGKADSRTTIDNGGGDIVASGDASLWLGQLNGAGRVISGGSLSLDITSSLNQSGTLAAGGDFTLNIHGNALTNSGTLSAGDRLTLTTGQLNNQSGGDINAGTTHIDAAGVLNQGLIDGGDVWLRTDTLHNTGTGRLYGDRLAIDARTLINDKTGDTAATIAAREDLRIATGQLINQEHGLIYSDGGLGIGGGLNEAGELTGQAGQVENLSATIEAMGDLHIDAAKTENRDIHLTVSSDLQTVSETPNVLEVELCYGEKWTEGCGRTNGQHYRMDGHLVEFNQDETSPVDFNFDADGRSYALDDQGNRLTVDVDGKPQYIWLWQDNNKDIIRYNLPGVSSDGRRFDIFSYTQRVKEQVVSDQDSAVIRSGGDLALNGDLHNKDSQVVAGQDLLIAGHVDNDETTIRQEITQDGVVVRAGKRKGHKQTHFEGQGKYQPPLQETDLPLHLTVQQQGQGPAEGRTIAAQPSTSVADGKASALNDPTALAQLGQQTLVTEVALPAGPSTDTQLKPVADTLTDDGHHASSDLKTRDSTADGLSDVTLHDAGSLTATPGDGTGTTQDGAQIDDTHSGPPVTIPPQEDWVLRSVTGPVKLPDNSLFSLHPGSASHYLVETDPRFTDGKQALSSGDFYSQDQLQKRLGDGYYEQRLVRDQVMKTTGQRYLSGYSDDENQYRALLASGLAFSERFNIAPGVDLSAEQMAQVTADMVLMVNQTVTLADGSRQVVSVPKLYARVQSGDLQGGGTLLAGNNVRISTAEAVLNSGSINGRELTSVSAGSLLNTGDISGNSTQLVTTGDIVNRGGLLKGGDRLDLQAGNDILSLTDSEQRGSESWLGRQAGIVATGDSGLLSLNAGHDIQLTASVVSNQGRDSTTRLSAGNDLTLDTATTRHATDYTRNSDNYDRTKESREVGSVISAGGSLLMQSGRDMNLRAADVTAGGDATLLAGSNLNLTSGEESWDQSSRAKWKKHGFLSKTTTTIQSEVHQKTALSSTVSGDTLTVKAGNDLTASGSNLLGTHDVTLSAGNNLTLGTAAESDHAVSVEQKKKSGFGGTGGIGFSLGHSSQKLTRDDSSNVQKGSVAGSSAGSLTLQAGNAATVHGSDLVAGQDLTVQGKNVSISAAENSHTALTKSESKSSGLTLGLSGTVGSALNTAVHQAKTAKKEESGRLAALKGTQAALTGYQAAQAAQLAAGATGGSSDGNIAGLTLSYGKQKSTSEQREEERTASGSHLQAGRDMHIAATGGDLTVEGAQLKAGQDMALSASRDLSLTSGKNSTQSSGHSSSHGGSVGAGLSAGGGALGLSVSASADHSHGHENGSSLTHSETTADAGRNLTLNSGHDTVLQGAQVSGDSVKADIGHNLQIASEQDRDHYDMKQTGSSVGGSVIGGMGIGGSASLSGSRDRMNSDFASVKEQSGVFAGKGGFDISVGSHTQLDGGAIASTAEKEKNRLDTGTLGWSDIHNKADYDVSHQGAGISTGGGVGEQFVGNMANNTLVGANGSGHDSSTTHAAVEDGTIVIRDKDKQQQDVATLDRDTEHAANGLSPIFDKEKEQRRLQEAQVIGEIGSQVGDIARTQGQIAGQKAEKDPVALNAAREQLAAGGKPYTESDVAQQAYNNAMAPWGTGSAIQQGIQAATAAIQGLAGGNVGQLLSGAAAPYLAEQIHKLAPDEASRAMAHAVVGAIVSYEAGNSAAAGAAGAVSGELMAQLVMKELYAGKQVSDLTETEKQTVSVLGTLAAGLAGGLTGGRAADGMAGAQAGKNSVENNYLSQKQQAQKDKEIAECQTVACKAGVQAKWTAIDLGQDGSFAAGMVAGVPAGLYDTIDSIVKTASSPQETYDALKSLFNSGDVLGNVSDAVKQSYIDRIDRMEVEYQKAGASGSFNAGVEGGKLVTDIAGLLAGGAGVAKGGAVLTEKVVAKVAGKAESAGINADKMAATAESASSGKLSGPTENWKNYTYAEAVAQTSATGRLVNADKAVIDPNKVTSYALNSEHPVGGNKAKVFESALGYNQSNAADLITKVQEGVKSNSVKMGSSDKFGQRMTIDMPITGPNGKTVIVRTGWIYDVGSTTPRMTTIYVNK